MNLADDELTTQQAATLCQASRTTVTRAAQTGDLLVARKLPGLRGAYLFYRDDVETWNYARLGGDPRYCHCPDPTPDVIGECPACHRLVESHATT